MGENLLLLLDGTTRDKSLDPVSKKEGNSKEEGLLENTSLDLLDLSDNDLTNAHGCMLLKFIKI